MATYSIVIPVYNEECYLVRFFNALKKKFLNGRDYEVIFVNDGSTDYSERIIKKLCEENENVRLVTLETNYGKEAAFVAGVKVASGDAVILMSISPLNPFDAINAVISKWLVGNEIVHAYRRDNVPSWWKKFKLNFFRFCSKAFGIKDTILPKPNVELYDRKVADILAVVPDRHTYMRNVNVWIDYKIATINYTARKQSEEGIKVCEELRHRYNEERIAKNQKQPKQMKKRIYAKSLWSAVSCFMAFAILLLTITLITSYVKGLVILKLVGFLGSFALAIISGIYAIRAWIIKRLGRVLVGASGEVYKIKELYGFECVVKD